MICCREQGQKLGDQMAIMEKKDGGGWDGGRVVKVVSRHLFLERASLTDVLINRI